MADTQMTLASQRADATTFLGSALNLANGTHGETFILPNTIGQCWIEEVLVQVTSIETMLAAVTTYGPVALIFDVASGATLDVVAQRNWELLFTSGASDAVAAVLKPNRDVFWQRPERLYIGFEGVDTGAAVGSDLTVVVRVKRVLNP